MQQFIPPIIFLLVVNNMILQARKEKNGLKLVFYFASYIPGQKDLTVEPFKV